MKEKLDRRSGTQREIDDIKEQLSEARKEIKGLQTQLDNYANVILAQQLELEAFRQPDKRVVPIKRPTRRDR